MVKLHKYDFSFAGFSMRENLMVRVAMAFREGEELDKLEIGEGNSHTGKKRLSEINRQSDVISHLFRKSATTKNGF